MTTISSNTIRSSITVLMTSKSVLLPPREAEIPGSTIIARTMVVSSGDDFILAIEIISENNTTTCILTLYNVGIPQVGKNKYKRVVSWAKIYFVLCTITKSKLDM